MANNNKHTGPNVPALRFPEFSGEWECKSLGEIGESLIGLTYSPSDVVKEGGTIVFRSSNIQDGVIDYGDLVRVSKKIKDSIITRDGDLLICARNGSTRLIGKNALLKKSDEGQTFGAFMMVFRSIDNRFVHQLLSTKAYSTQVSENLGARINQITTRNFAGYTFGMPQTLEEKEKIGTFLELINDRIETQSKIIEEQETLLRSLRHKIYSRVQAQSQCTIADVLCYEQPTKYLVTDTYYTDDDSQVPVLTANKAFILGYTTENFGIYDKGPCIILDDFTLDCKYVDFKFKVKSSAIKILRAKAKTNLRFIFEYFRFLELNTTEHRRHYIAEIEPMSILLPSNEEIDRIARLFTALDERLETARKELKILESQKMYMLQKMFI